MSKINRYDGDLKAFGADSVSTERTVFGDTTQSDSLDDNLNADFFRGWGIVGVNDFPPREWFNAIGFSLGQILAYLHQMGIAEWNTAQEYHAGSACIDGAGKVYISKINSNTGNALPADEDSNWKRVLDFSDLNDTALTGNPTAPTQASGNNSTRLATTEFVYDRMVGTVSESAGVPTGDIIETGSNANGNYVKYADGTLICWRKGLAFSVTSSATASQVFTFPVAFADTTNTFVSCELENTVVGAAWFVYVSNVQSVSTGGFFAADRDGTARSGTVDYNMMAIGRWF